MTVDDEQAMVMICDARRPESKLWGAVEWLALGFLLGAATMATALAG